MYVFVICIVTVSSSSTETERLAPDEKNQLIRRAAPRRKVNVKLEPKNWKRGPRPLPTRRLRLSPQQLAAQLSQSLKYRNVPIDENSGQDRTVEKTEPKEPNFSVRER